MAFYLDGYNIGDSTRVFTDEAMTIPAANGYYSDGDIVRQCVDGVLLPVSRCPRVIPTGETINLAYNTPTAAKLAFNTNPGDGCIAMDIAVPLEPFSPLILFENKFIWIFKPVWTDSNIHFTESNGKYFPITTIGKINEGFLTEYGVSETSGLYNTFIKSLLLTVCGYENHDLVQDDFNLPGGHQDLLDHFEENNKNLPSTATGFERLSTVYINEDGPEYNLSYAYWAGDRIEYTGTNIDIDYGITSGFFINNSFHNSPHPFTTRVPIPKENIDSGILEFFLYGYAATQSGFSIKIHSPIKLRSFSVNLIANQTEEEAINSTLNNDPNLTTLRYFMPATGDIHASNFVEGDFVYKDELGTLGASTGSTNIMGWHKDFRTNNRIFRLDGHTSSFCKIVEIKSI